MNDEHMTTNEPLVFYHHVGKLSKLAKMSLLAELMQHTLTLIRQRCQNKEGGSNSNVYAYQCEHRQIQPELPLSFHSGMENLNYNMHRSRVNWWTYHYECVFSHRESPDSMIGLLPLLVWLPDASISFEQTARKMLNSDELTNVEKFVVACTYCFMDDVIRLQQTLTKKELKNATSGHRRYGVPFLDYWHSKLYDLIDNLYVGTWHINLLVRSISSKNYHDNWPAVKYFWDQLDYVERLPKAVAIIDADRPVLTWHLLVELSSLELDVVIERRSPQIIRTLVKELKYFEYIILIWKRMVNLIDDQALADIMCFVHEFQDISRGCVDPLLWEMWLCISERQKMVIVDKHICDFIQTSLNMECDFYYEQNFPLIIDLLSRFSAERRLQYWSLHWPYLVPGQIFFGNRTSIDQIMKLCLVNDETIAAFKCTTMLDYDSISDYCQHHVRYRRFDILQEYLEFCTSDLQVIRNMKKQIITKMPKRRQLDVLFPFVPSHTNEFNSFMEGVFTPTEYEEFIYKIISHPKNVERLCSKLCMLYTSVDVVSIIEKHLTSEEHLAKVKFEIFKICRRSDKIKEAKMVDLMAWCFNGDKILVEQFHKLLPPVSETNDEMKGVPTSIYEAFRDEWTSHW
ncbi:uncharacterized protein LOC135845523 [Planococcus citri]|uniref:uncharacterized protein LOC135845523 n=1 Tax=Planococcus citri TaxID=170843 RepID=UPI0031F73772